MASSGDVVRRFQDSLDAYIKPREQVNYIRRILALHLASLAGTKRATQPFALLTHNHNEAQLRTETSGLYKEYIDALNANTQAQQEFQATLETNHERSTPDLQEKLPKPDILGDRMIMLRLYKKRERLSTIRDYLDELTEKPAASDDFLNPSQIFEDAASLPNVPPQVMSSLSQEDILPAGDLENRLKQLEKLVLRAQTLKKKEERYLREAQARAKEVVKVSNEAKIEALSATRNELITWIESELSKASSAETEEASGANVRQEASHGELSRNAIDQNLKDVGDKYQQYVSTRADLLALISAPIEQLKPPRQGKAPTEDTVSPEHVPTSHLIIPYVEALSAISRRQKAIISHKSHVKSTLAKQSQVSLGALGNLVNDSQLLPAYPTEDATQRRPGSYDQQEYSQAEHTGLAKGVLPWVFAAESAKIATFEAVAEDIEKGQFALEKSSEGLKEIRKLLGKQETATDEEIKQIEQETDGSRTWPGAAEEKASIPRRRANTGAKKKKATQDAQDAWSKIHGNLGLIGQEDTAK